MKFTRTVAGLTTAGLLGVTPLVLAAAPANAGATLTTATSLKITVKKLSYGDEVLITGGTVVIDPTTGAEVPDYVGVGTASLQIATPKNQTWTEIAVDDTPSTTFFTDIKAVSNAQYRVVYSGGTNTDSEADVFLPSESAPVNVRVARKLELSETKRDLVLKAKVTPDFKKKKIVVQIKKGKKYSLLKKVRTDKKGVAVIKFPAPRRGGRLYFKVIIPADKNFMGLIHKVSTYTY